MAAPIADDIDAELRNYHTATAGLTNGLEMGREAGWPRGGVLHDLVVILSACFCKLARFSLSRYSLTSY